MKIIESFNASGVDVECMAYLLNKHKISIYIFDNFIQIIGVQKIWDPKERKKDLLYKYCSSSTTGSLTANLL